MTDDRSSSVSFRSRDSVPDPSRSPHSSTARRYERYAAITRVPTSPHADETSSGYSSQAAATAAARARWRQDYSRSQHAEIPESLLSSPKSSNEGAPMAPVIPANLTPEQARYEAYVNRFSVYDPRSSPIRKASSPERRPPAAPFPTVPSLRHPVRTTVPVAERVKLLQQQRSLSGSNEPPLSPTPRTYRAVSPRSGGFRADSDKSQDQPRASVSKTRAIAEKFEKQQQARVEFSSSPPVVSSQPSLATSIGNRGSSSSTRSNSSSSAEQREPRTERHTLTTVDSSGLTTPTSPSRPSGLGRRSHSEGSRLNVRVTVTSSTSRSPSTEKGRRHSSDFADLPRKTTDISTTTRSTVDSATSEAERSSVPNLRCSPSFVSLQKSRSESAAETPPATKVNELKTKLWDQHETLQVAVQPTLREDEAAAIATKRAYRPIEGPEMAGPKGQRVSRSVSPSSRRAKSENGSYLTQARFFKSRFYEAAIASRIRDQTPPRQHASSVSDVGGSSQARTLERSLPRPNTFDSPVVTERDAEQRESAPVSPPTPISPSNRSVDPFSSVSKLVAQLSSVSRDDPQAALAQIDSILKAESHKKGSELRSLRMSEAIVDKVINSDEEEDDDDDDDDDDDEESYDETSVSSITNPTYQSGTPTPEQLDASISTNNFRRNKPNALANYSQNNHVTITTQPLEHERGKSSSRRRRAQTPPPESIHVSSAKQLQMDKQLEVDKKRDENNPLDPTSAEAIALKIKMWDEMSVPGPGDEKKEETSAATEDLGSIVTPASVMRSESSSPAVGRRSHPWDLHHPLNPGSGSRSVSPMVQGSRGSPSTNGSGSMLYNTGLPISDSVLRARAAHVRKQYQEKLLGQDSDSIEISTGPQMETEEPNLLSNSYDPIMSPEKPSLSTIETSGNFSGDHFDVDPKLLERDDGFGGSDFESIVARTVVTADALDDAAWVPLPTNPFFKEPKSNPATPQKPSPAGRPPRADYTSLSEGERDPNRKVEEFSPVVSTKSVSSASSLERRSSSTGRAGRSRLRSVLGRSKSRTPTKNSGQSLNESSSFDGSLASSAASVRSSNTFARRRSRQMAVSDSGVTTPRNANLAKKLSRLMRVYDTDKAEV
eukprot:CAMPEP_0194042670 /NCGR_PEP_ID=MMETSP0009_2-20130614/14421_1 /TAXON_ID=210454 /ORGANISM="Grammatophora oceanica, Strain CCMP 410" /LENGTH=1113 /DNA_ID=CAMNT_0038686603 /DNA_START=60 /DNA_END=3401 /DNA_ORIENTATION=+